MKDTNIKYIIITESDESFLYNLIRKYNSPYGKLCIVSEDPDSYVLIKSKNICGIDKLIKFYDTRKEARSHKYNTIEFVIKVRVKNNKIIEWIKKNP